MKHNLAIILALKTSLNNTKEINQSSATLALVSVIIPFYNDYEYLPYALESCFNNTYANIEIIIVDDCSDKPLNIKDLKIPNGKYPIMIHRNLINKGPGYSRNVGIRLAKGEYIAFLDADDLWRTQIVEKQMRVFMDNPEMVWVYTDGNYLVDGQFHHKLNSSYHRFPNGVFPSGAKVNEYHLQGYNYLTFSSNMFRKSALMAIGLFDETLPVSEDWDLFVRMGEKFPHGVYAINESLMVYRVNNKGRHFVNRADYVEVNVQILTAMYKRQGLFDSQQKSFDKAVALIYQRAGIQRLNAGHQKEARNFLFHPKTKPRQFELRMMALRLLSYLPTIAYINVLKIYDRLPAWII